MSRLRLVFVDYKALQDSKYSRGAGFSIFIVYWIPNLWLYRHILRTLFCYFVTHRYVRLRQASFHEVALLLRGVWGHNVYISLKSSCPNSRPFSFKQVHIKLSMAGFMPEPSCSSFPILPPPNTSIVTVANPPPYL